jgi:hypothetical protein
LDPSEQGAIDVAVVYLFIGHATPKLPKTRQKQVAAQPPTLTSSSAQSPPAPAEVIRVTTLAASYCAALSSSVRHPGNNNTAGCTWSERANTTGLNRETLYRTLSENGKPRLSSLGLIIEALGLRLSIESSEDGPRAA